MMDVEAAAKQGEDNKKLMMAGSSSTADDTHQRRRRRRRRCMCVGVSVGVIVLGLGLLLLILALTVFKPKRPVTTVDSVSVEDMDFSLDLASLRAVLNVTLAVGMSVTNPNRVGFTYANSTAFLRYRGSDVGDVPIPAGRIGPRDTRPLNLTLTLMADRLLSNSALYSDALAGTLPFQTYIRIPGKVRILFTFHVVTYTTCDLQIDIANRRVSNQRCHYRTKL